MANNILNKDKLNIYKNNVNYIHGNAKSCLDSLISRNRTFKLIITSPPYNMDKEYEKSKSLYNYKKEIEIIIEKLVHLLDDEGSICWQVGNYVNPKSKEVIPLDIFYHDIFKKFNFILRNRIIWHFGHGLHASLRFSGRYETIMWYTKNSNYTFKLDSVRIPAKYPGKKSYKGEKKGQISGNPIGKNPSDVWVILKKEWDKDLWEIPNVKAHHKEKTIHPCQYPIELVERCVLALTNEGDWILDPYAGVGSTLIAAIKNNRNSIGIEKYKKFIRIGEQRIELFKEGKLPIREIGTPIFIPDPKTAVAKKPDNFYIKK